MPYLDSVIAKLDEFVPGLWFNPELVRGLPAESARLVVSYLLELACQCQNSANIELGRQGICAFPSDWTLEIIPRVVDETLNLNDEWEYRRLLELYGILDKGLLRELVNYGRSHDLIEIRDAANDFS